MCVHRTVGARMWSVASRVDEGVAAGVDSAVAVVRDVEASRRVRAEEGAVAGRSSLRSDGAVVGP